MLLVCSQRCGGRLFRALFAEVEIDPSGEFQDYRVTQPGYVCLNCGAPALDLGEVPAELDKEAREDEAAAAPVADVLCPVCETMVQLDANMECPNCGSPLEVG
jgi:ssDNA-binding Zn-finger/Zn-ribbon topoisomerase 1